MINLTGYVKDAFDHMTMHIVINGVITDNNYALQVYPSIVKTPLWAYDALVNLGLATKVSMTATEYLESAKDAAAIQLCKLTIMMQGNLGHVNFYTPTDAAYAIINADDQG